MMQHHGFMERAMRRLTWLMLALVALGVAPEVWAANPTCSGGNLALSLPNVTVTHNTPVGTLLGSPTTGTASFTCSNLPTTKANSPTLEAGIQIFNLQASQLFPATLPSTTSTNINTVTFATTVTGIALQLTISPAMRGYDQNPGDQQPNAYMVGYVGEPGGTLTVSYAAQLIVTGAVTPGTISALTLLNYEWYIYGCANCNGASTSASLGTHLTINGGTTVSLQGCTVNTSSAAFTVTLPTVASSALRTTGSTAGETPFNINLSCQTGTTVLITMSAANANATNAGVINPTTGTGFATNVGVQLLYAGTDVNGSVTPAPVTFNTAQSLGASPSGSMAIQYHARYFATGTPVAGGNVAATATFTMSYQ
jgi:type 1 fimbria pilin